MNLALLLAIACTGDTATVPVPETTVPDTGDTATGDCATETGTVVETGGDSATDTVETGDTVETADTGEPIDTTPPEWCPAIAEAVQVGVVVAVTVQWACNPCLQTSR